MRMYVFYAFTASFPVFAMTAVAILVIGSRLKQLVWKEKPRKEGAAWACSRPTPRWVSPSSLSR